MTSKNFEEIKSNENGIKNDSTKRKRPERVKAYSQKKLIKVLVVKASLPGHLNETRIYHVLDKWILLASKLSVQQTSS